MGAVIVDFRADKVILNNLEKLGFDIIPSFKSRCVCDNLSGHPDLQICKLPGGVYICTPETFEYYKDKLKNYDVSVICGNKNPGCNYPEDTAYNIAWVGEYAAHLGYSTDSHIKEYIKKLNLKFIDVPQGYTKCNICIVSKNSFITSDKGIYNAFLNEDVDVLLIEKDHIGISGWEYGFIGGASGKIDDSTLVFTGNISLHPDCHKIKSFCSDHGVDCISLSDDRLMDLGTVISIDNSESV